MIELEPNMSMDDNPTPKAGEGVVSLKRDTLLPDPGRGGQLAVREWPAVAPAAPAAATQP